MAVSESRKKAKRRKQATAAAAETPSSEDTDTTPAGFPPLEWERQDPVRPGNRQRALLGIAIGLLLAWWAALGWLVWDSLAGR